MSICWSTLEFVCRFSLILDVLGKCLKSTKNMNAHVPLSLGFVTKTSKPPIKPVPTPTPCSGLTDETWPRPKAKQEHTILACVLGTNSVYHGSRRRDIICMELFGTTHDTSLTKNQAGILEEHVKAESTWWVDRVGPFRSLRSTKCERTLPRIMLYGGHPKVCRPCWEVRKDTSLNNAVNKSYAFGELSKHTKKAFMEADAFEPKRKKYVELNELSTNLETASKSEDDQAFWVSFSAHCKAGKFANNQAFTGLCMAVATRAARDEQGKGQTGMHFQSYFDHFLSTLAALSPRGAQLFTETFAGRGARSRRDLTQKAGMSLICGLHAQNFNRVVQHLAAINYTGPLAVGSDETVCVKSLRVHDGMLVGAMGGNVVFDSTEDLAKKAKSLLDNKKLASKVSKSFSTSLHSRY